MTNEEKITRLRWIQRYTSILPRAGTRDFEALEAAIEDIETLDGIKSKLGNVLKELEEESIADNRLMAVSGMSIEELTDAFTKGYRLVSPEVNDQVPDMRVTIDEARITFQILHRSLVDELDKETEGQQSEEQESEEVMTNGDVIKGAFPNAEIKRGLYGIKGTPLVCLCQHTNTEMYEASFAEEWWSAPYKEREKEE